MSLQPQVPRPQSFTSNPPFPVVSSIIAEIKTRQSGRGRSSSSSPWPGYTLAAEGYAELLRRVQKDPSLQGFVDDKLRCDYFPCMSQLILRRPTMLHELIVGTVVRELQRQLDKLAGDGEDSSTCTFAGNVVSCGSTTLRFPNAEYGSHDPDAQFRHLDARYPGVVIELSYSQKRRDLLNLADDYILGSDGKIQVVIGLDIEYSQSKKATLSVWRPGVETNEAGETALVAKQTIVDQILRDEQGNANMDSNAGLHLQIGDFAATAKAPPLGPLTSPLCIPAAQLHSYLEMAEKMTDNIERGSAPVGTWPWTTKRRREQTPMSLSGLGNP